MATIWVYDKFGVSEIYGRKSGGSGMRSKIAQIWNWKNGHWKQKKDKKIGVEEERPLDCLARMEVEAKGAKRLQALRRIFECEWEEKALEDHRLYSHPSLKGACRFIPSKSGRHSNFPTSFYFPAGCHIFPTILDQNRKLNNPNWILIEMDRNQMAPFFFLNFWKSNAEWGIKQVVGREWKGKGEMTLGNLWRMEGRRGWFTKATGIR